MRPVKVPPMLQALVQTAVFSVEGREFAELAACPSCGGPLGGYDWKDRKFATVIDEEELRPIMVRVRRFRCRDCGRVSPSRAPFYPDTRLGSPVVDLCVVLSRTMTPGRTVMSMKSLGIAVDRGTVRDLSCRTFPEIATTEIFGFVLPRSVISLSMIAFRNL
jgi:hypothetical protein